MISTYNQTMLVIITISYLLGSIPTAYLVAKYHSIDIFKVGSGNMGATNVTRAMGFRWGLLVLAIDVLKGIVAIYIGIALTPATRAGAITVAATVVTVGHNWSLFAALLTGTLRGGKGAATAFGTILMFAPIQVIVGMAIMGGAIVAVTRYVSLAVLTAFLLAILWITVLIWQEQLAADYIVYAWLLALMLVYRHRENIQRLIAGTERRLGENA